MDVSLIVPEIKQILNKISSLEEKLTVNKTDIPEWLNDEQCWKLKGGCSFSTYRTKRFYQCKGGIPDGKVGGRKVWRRETVLEWLPISDKDLPEYHKKYKTGATQ